MICYFLLLAFNMITTYLIIMIKAFALFAFFILGHAEYCFSQCLSPTFNSSCGVSPYTCTSYDPLFAGLGTLAAGYSQVQMVTSTGITAVSNFKMSSTFTPATCSFTYTLTTLTFDYNILGQFVSTDYIYKRYTIIQPHYQVTVRLSMVFIGVWAASDYLNLYTFDGTTERNFPMRYSCTELAFNYTESLCGSRTGNKVDCILSYTFTFPHNSTYLLVNFTSLTNIRDPNIQYWSIFDLNIATKDCNGLCASCYSTNTPSTCTSCAASSYLTGNTCGACAGGMLQLPNANPLLGGFCVASCPPGYFASGITCSPCVAGCLSCTSATACLITSTSAAQTTLWRKLLPLWIIIIVAGTFVILGIFWKCLAKESIQNEERERIISQSNEKQADEKMTTQERQEPIDKTNEKNVYIEEIDFNDHIKVDLNPRKRKRQERDMNQSNINISF